jgi:hypothetical protein
MKMSEIFPGLNVKEAAKDIYETFKIKGVQGAAEVAQALFLGNGFTPYGRGQGAPKDHDHEPPQQAEREPQTQEQPTQEQEREGR